LQSDNSNYAKPRQRLAERVLCPVHGGANPNVSLWTDERGQRRAWCHSHHCSPREILRSLGEPSFGQHAGPSQSSLNEAQRIARAYEKWERAQSANQTIVRMYLAIRGITALVPPSIRYEPRARHLSGEIAQAMLAAIVREDQFIGVQMTFLKLDAGGNLTLHPAKIISGVVRGGAVRLAPAAETLVICEGIETGLSVMQATGLPVWACLGAGNLARIVIPEIVSELIIAADNDVSGVGQKAAYKAAERFIAQGRTVRIPIPSRPGQDFNDLLREGGAL
jgi:phage/plasmid primase-like uncharacterized protein